MAKKIIQAGVEKIRSHRKSLMVRVRDGWVPILDRTPERTKFGYHGFEFTISDSEVKIQLPDNSEVLTASIDGEIHIQSRLETDPAKAEVMWAEALQYLGLAE